MPSELASSAVDLHVDVRLSPHCLESGLHGPMGAILEGHVRNVAGELAADLGFSGSVHVELGEGKLDTQVERHRFDIFVNGRPCIVDMTLPSQQISDLGGLGTAIGEALFWNREKFVTLGLVDALLARPVAPNISAEQGTFSTEELSGILEAAFRYGFDLADGIEVAEEMSGTVDEPAQRFYLLETLFANRFPPRIDVEVSPHLYDELTRVSDDAKQIAGALSPPEEVDNQKNRGEVDNPLAAKLVDMRERIFSELGLRLPPIEAKRSQDLLRKQFRLCFNRLRGPVREGLSAGEAMVIAHPALLRAFGLQGRPSFDPGTLMESVIVPDEAEARQRCAMTSIEILDQRDHFVATLRSVLVRLAAEYLSMAQVEDTLHRFDQWFPMPVFNALERYRVIEITNVLKGLLRERVSIRDLRGILEAMLEMEDVVSFDARRHVVIAGGCFRASVVEGDRSRPNTQDCVEFVRQRLRRQIANTFTRGWRTLLVFTMDREIEDRISSVDREPLTEREHFLLISAIHGQVYRLPAIALSPVLLTVQPARAKLRRLIELAFPRLPVISYPEVPPATNIQPLGKISW